MGALFIIMPNIRCQLGVSRALGLYGSPYLAARMRRVLEFGIGWTVSLRNLRLRQD